MSIESQDDLAEDEVDTWQRRIDRYIDSLPVDESRP
jgi:hypothetical protein